MGLITYENLEDGQKVTANVFNERFAQIVAQINGNIDDSNIKDDSISKQKLKAEVFESMYPVGSQYVNYTDNTNPATLLGFGTWSAIAGRVTVGYDGSQTEFNAAEKTGGAKTVSLTGAQNGAHTHAIDPPAVGTSAAGDHSHGTTRDPVVTSGSGNSRLYNGGSGQQLAWSQGSLIANSGNHAHTVDIPSFSSASSGTGEAHENLPPYVTAYVWKRIS